MTSSRNNLTTLDALLRRFSTLGGRAPNAHSPAMELKGDHSLNPGMAVKADLRPAAVLVPIVARAPEPTVLFTLRTAHLVHHAGQISFPGGHMEPGDTRAEDAALRETEEEVGLARRHIRVIGRLDRYVTRTGFDVTPVVGVVTPPFAVAPDAEEVADVFEVPLYFLLDPANHLLDSRTVEGTVRRFYAMRWRERYIWGATAGMLMNLYEFLRHPAPEGADQRSRAGICPRDPAAP
ncbi:MAG: CoA pyrophosphatase [Acidimicrobiia bacterium]|nr:CoA pyrophosphatase [Acidimicrobiia bacterium]